MNKTEHKMTEAGKNAMAWHKNVSINQSDDFLNQTKANKIFCRISLDGYPCQMKKASQQLHLKECEWLYGILQKGKTKHQAALITQVFI